MIEKGLSSSKHYKKVWLLANKISRNERWLETFAQYWIKSQMHKCV